MSDHNYDQVVQSPQGDGQITDGISWLRAGIAAAKAGLRGEALENLRRAVSAKPDDEAAWMWLAGVTDDPRESLAALAHVLTMNPGNRRARAGIRWARTRDGRRGQTATGEAATVVVNRSSGLARRPAEATGQTTGFAKRLGVYMRRQSVALAFTGVMIGFLCGAFLLLAGAVCWQPAFTGIPPAVLTSGWQALLPTATPTTAEEFARLKPRLEKAWAERRWTEAIALLELIHSREPEYPGIKERLVAAYTAQGVDLVEADYPQAALLYFERALALRPDDPEAWRNRYLAANYVAGSEAYQSCDWESAIRSLKAIHARAPGYLHVRELLYSAYYNLGLARQFGGRLAESRQAFESAIQVKADEEQAYRKLAELNHLFPPTPTPPPPPDKRIVIDLSEQRLYAYQGDTPVYIFITSTGEPGRETKPGTYKVLDKIPMAYASIWNLKMPYWLGIYWVGLSENGIHALPILSNGQKLWDGFLGQRVSYGCIILGTEEARTLYEWAEVGTPVIIQP
jgi:tetratricopeptide (TPR) repeat protein